MQDVATFHTTNIREEYPREKFGSCFIQKDQWPPNSPDCNSLDYFFKDAVKCKVYVGQKC